MLAATCDISARGYPHEEVVPGPDQLRGALDRCQLRGRALSRAGRDAPRVGLQRRLGLPALLDPPQQILHQAPMGISVANSDRRMSFCWTAGVARHRVADPAPWCSGNSHAGGIAGLCDDALR